MGTANIDTWSYGHWHIFMENYFSFCKDIFLHSFFCFKAHGSANLDVDGPSVMSGLPLCAKYSTR